MTAPSNERPPLFFIHGLFMTGESWAPMRAHFEGLGYRCVTPSWPFREGSPAALRAEPDPRLSTLTLPAVIEAMRAEIAALDEPPIIVAHSMGGLVALHLAQEPIARRVVAIAPAPPRGVMSFAFSHIRSTIRLLWPTSTPVVPSFRWFRYALANTGDDAAARTRFERCAVPDSRLVGRAPLSRSAAIDFAGSAVPIHFISMTADHIIPSSLVTKVVRRFIAAGADVSHEVLEGASHLAVCDDHWPALAALVEPHLSDRA